MIDGSMHTDQGPVDIFTSERGDQKLSTITSNSIKTTSPTRHRGTSGHRAHGSDFGVFDPKSDQFVQQLLGAAAVIDKDNTVALKGKRGSQGSTPRDESLDYMKIR